MPAINFLRVGFFVYSCITLVQSQSTCPVEQSEQYYACLKNVQDDAAKNNENLKIMTKCFLR